MDGWRVKDQDPKLSYQQQKQKSSIPVVVDSEEEILFNEAHLVYAPLHHHPPLRWDVNENDRGTKEEQELELLGFFFSSECFVAV